MNDTLLLKYVGYQIQQRRIQKGLTQRELCLHISLSRSALSNIEKGRHWMNIEALWKLTQALGCKIDDLFPDEMPVEMIVKVIDIPVTTIKKKRIVSFKSRNT